MPYQWVEVSKYRLMEAKLRAWLRIKFGVSDDSQFHLQVRVRRRRLETDILPTRRSRAPKRFYFGVKEL